VDMWEDGFKSRKEK